MVGVEGVQGIRRVKKGLNSEGETFENWIVGQFSEASTNVGDFWDFKVLCDLVQKAAGQKNFNAVAGPWNAEIDEFYGWQIQELRLTSAPSDRRGLAIDHNVTLLILKCDANTVRILIMLWEFRNSGRQPDTKSDFRAYQFGFCQTPYVELARQGVVYRNRESTNVDNAIEIHSEFSDAR
jgi:hypothetical protein